jgi:hypothetical protein
MAAVILGPHLIARCDEIVSEWLIALGVFAQSVHKVNHGLRSARGPSIEIRRHTLGVDEAFIDPAECTRHG